MVDPYLSALQRELKLCEIKDYRVKTVYLGGGTPSILSPVHVDQILGMVKSGFTFEPEPEITLEVNPGTVTCDQLNGYRSAGINRLSMGVQSFDNEKLKFLTRIHNADQSLKAVDDAIRAGFENIGIDLIYGLPGESEQTWQADLDQAVSLNLSHLSCYMLTVEPRTPLFERVLRKESVSIDNAVQSAMFRQTATFLTGQGYTHYEISNFAHGKENRSRHNSNYWYHHPYLGFGPSAHSFDGKKRWWNHDNLEQYMACLKEGQTPVKDSETLESDQLIMETIMLGLRTSEGIDLKKFHHRFSISFETRFRKILQRLKAENLGRIRNHCYALTLDGKMRLNSIVEEFADELFKA